MRLQLLVLKKRHFKRYFMLLLKHLHKQKVSDTGAINPIPRPVIQGGDCFQKVVFQVKAVGWKTQLDYRPGWTRLLSVQPLPNEQG